VYVIGGRRSALGSQTGRILAVDPRTGKSVAAGRLPHALSDATAVAEDGRILVLGGRDASGAARDEIFALEPSR